jgi:ribosomal protein S18 acetylase RimI-like enzyme
VAQPGLVKSRIIVREGTERDFPQVTRIQMECADAAQWPLGDYSMFALLVAELEGSISGFCWWRQSSNDEAELLNLGVSPNARRRGLAAALLRELRGRAKGEIFLEVAENNRGAILLYTREGWVQIGSRPGYYPQGINAIVMKKGSC